MEGLVQLEHTTSVVDRTSRGLSAIGAIAERLFSKAPGEKIADRAAQLSIVGGLARCASRAVELSDEYRHRLHTVSAEYLANPELSGRRPSLAEVIELLELPSGPASYEVGFVDLYQSDETIKAQFDATCSLVNDLIGEAGATSTKVASDLDRVEVFEIKPERTNHEPARQPVSSSAPKTWGFKLAVADIERGDAGPPLEIFCRIIVADMRADSSAGGDPNLPPPSARELMTSSYEYLENRSVARVPISATIVARRRNSAPVQPLKPNESYPNQTATVPSSAAIAK